MTVGILERHRQQVDRAIMRALVKHKNVRDAAAALGMPKSTLFGRAKALGLKTDWR